MLTPLAIDPGHPFPHLLNKSLNLAVVLKRPADDEHLYAVVQVPSVLESPKATTALVERGDSRAAESSERLRDQVGLRQPARTSKAKEM